MAPRAHWPSWRGGRGGNRKLGRGGAALLYLILVLVLVGLLGAAISRLSPSALQTKVTGEFGDRAYYNAQSGLNYILAKRSELQTGKSSFADFLSAMGGDNTMVTLYLPEGGQFTYKLTSQSTSGTSGTFTVSSLTGTTGGTSAAPQYAYQLFGGGKGASETYTYTPETTTTADPSKASYYVLYSANSGVSVAGAATITGNIYGVTFTSQQTSIVGNIIAKGAATLNFSTSVTGNLCAGTTATLDQSSVSGALTALGNVQLKYASTVGGSIYSGGNVVMADSVSVGGDINAQGYEQFGYANAIGGNAYANGNITFSGTASTIAKSAYSGGTITLSWASKIANTAVAATAVNVVSGSSVGTALVSSSYPPNIKPIAPTSCTTVTAPTPATFSAGTKNVSVAWGATTYNTSNPLAPGSYKNLTLSGSSPLTLTAGTYYFNSISLGYGSTLNLDLSGGDITIFVVGAVDLNMTSGINVSTDGSTWQGMTSVDKAYAARVYLEAHDAIKLEWATNWYGTLFSTKSITFGGSNTIIGAYATIGSDALSWAASVTYVASNYALANW